MYLYVCVTPCITDYTDMLFCRKVFTMHFFLSSSDLSRTEFFVLKSVHYTLLYKKPVKVAYVTDFHSRGMYAVMYMHICMSSLCLLIESFFLLH